MGEIDQTLNDLRINSQALRDSISSLTSLDLNSNANTPGTSPASSIGLTSPSRRRSPSLGRPSAASSRKSSVSHIPRSPYTLHRAPASPSLSSNPSMSPRATAPSSFARTVSSPVSSNASTTARRIPSLTRNTTSSLSIPSRPSSSLSHRPKWNSSVKSDNNFGHQFKPLTLTTPSPYRNCTTPTPGASSPSGRHSSLGGATRIPVPSPLAQNTISNPLAPRLAAGFGSRSTSSTTTTAQRRTSMPVGPSVNSYLTSPSPAPRTVRPELRNQSSASKLRDPSAGPSTPKINIRPASAMSQGIPSGRRSSMLPRPPSGIGNRQSMPPGSGKPRWRPVGI